MSLPTFRFHAAVISESSLVLPAEDPMLTISTLVPLIIIKTKFVGELTGAEAM
jgi:hypothetical protein